MVCKCKPVSPVRGLSPLRGDLPHRSLDGGGREGGIYVGITTLSLTQKQTLNKLYPSPKSIQFLLQILTSSSLNVQDSDPVEIYHSKARTPTILTMKVTVSLVIHVMMKVTVILVMTMYRMSTSRLLWLAGRLLILFASTHVGGGGR